MKDYQELQSQAKSAAEVYIPSNSKVIENPYPFYDQMRAIAPIIWSEPLQSFLVTRYAEVSLILKDNRFSGGPSRLQGLFRNFAPEEVVLSKELYKGLAGWTLFMDPPNHTRIRAHMNRMFVPQLVRGMTSKVEAITNELVENCKAKGRFDFIQDFAYPLPVMVIAELLGVPKEDRDLLKKWSDDIAAFMARLMRPYSTAVTAQASILEMHDYMRKIVREKMANPSDDMISVLCQGDATSRLTEDEIAQTASMILFAGHETTTNLLGNGMLALLQHPEQEKKLRADFSLMPSAVEEFMRYDSPVQFTSRIANETLVFGGVKFEAGQRAITFMGAANRDPQEFPNPHVLDVTRNPTRQLAFGQGIHFCVGAPLSRLEGKIAFEKMLSAFPTLKIEPQTLQWREDLGFRGMKSLILQG